MYDGFIIASGGVRSGLDGAKAIAIGANAFSMSRPLLLSALKGYDETKKFIDNLFREFKATMFLTGSKNISELSRAPVVLGQDIISC